MIKKIVLILVMALTVVASLQISKVGDDCQNMGNFKSDDHIQSRDPKTGYIYLDPKIGKPTNTIIFLPAYTCDSTEYLQFFTQGHGALPSSRIILTQAHKKWNPIWGGAFTYSWFKLNGVP